ncbi:serine/threonine-protein kinase Sgk2, partial [Metarhizium brunneum ARSEF 3297]
MSNFANRSFPWTRKAQSSSESLRPMEILRPDSSLIWFSQFHEKDTSADVSTATDKRDASRARSESSNQVSSRQQLPSLHSLFGPPSSIRSLHSPSEKETLYLAQSPLDRSRKSPGVGNNSTSYFPTTVSPPASQPRRTYDSRLDAHSLARCYSEPRSPKYYEQQRSRSDSRDECESSKWSVHQDVSRYEHSLGSRDPTSQSLDSRAWTQLPTSKGSSRDYSCQQATQSSSSGPPTQEVSAASEGAPTKDGLGPRIWTGTHFLPRFVRAADVPGEGMCYFYDDGSHCKTVIDGEVVNSHWGVTKAGKPRKRLAIACIPCREKKIKSTAISLDEMDQAEKAPIEESAIWKELNTFRASFNSICRSRSVSCNAEILSQLSNTDLRRLSLNLLVALQNLPAARVVPSKTGPGPVENDLLRLLSAVTADNFLTLALVSNAVVESTPPPRAIHSSTQQTPWSQNTSSFVNSSEYRQNVDPVLKLELEHLYVGVPNFYRSFFGDIPELDGVSEAVFRHCTEGDSPLFKDGWSGWPVDAKESDVLTWIGGLISQLEAIAEDLIPTSMARRKLLAQPRTLLEGSTGKRSLDIGFVDSDIIYKPHTTDSTYRWAHILVVGELKSNPKADIASIAWIDLARVWEYDRLGGIASEQFDINTKEGGLQFVTTMLGFLRMNEEMLGFDPAIITTGTQRYIEIQRDDKTERLIIDEVMKRAPCIAGRATTCWKAHRNDDPHSPLVIKDSWQYIDRATRTGLRSKEQNRHEGVHGHWRITR